MLKVGLTGGIGCGKSTVCNFFSELGVPVIDTDDLARQAVMQGTECLRNIVAKFGRNILLPDGSLNRAVLRTQVFSDSSKLKKLEAIVHPEIRNLLSQQLGKIRAPYVIIAIPLLIEKRWEKEVDRILVIDCAEEIQLERASARDGNDQNQIRHIMSMQASRKDRLAVADDVINNDFDTDTLKHRVHQLHSYYSNMGAGN